jgi:anti-anti-sigma factor
MMMDYRHLSVNLVDGVTVVRFKNLASEVHSEEAIQEISIELQGLLDQIQACSLVLDFENQEFIPSGAFDGRLVRLQRMVTQRNGTLRLCNLHPIAIQLFKLNRLADYLSLCNSMEEALDACLHQKPLLSDGSGNNS